MLHYYNLTMFCLHELSHKAGSQAHQVGNSVHTKSIQVHIFLCGCKHDLRLDELHLEIPFTGQKQMA